MEQRSASSDQPHLAGSTDAVVRLTLFGWHGGLAAIIVGLALSFFLFGYATVYWRNADMDFMVIYNALVMNDGKPQQFFDHTAYLTILTVKAWFRLLHSLGLLDAWTLSAMPPPTDRAAFDLAMTHAVRAGRVLAFLIATGSVLIFAGLVRRIVSDRRLAVLVVFAFAFSGGMAEHMRILRSELVAALPVLFALMLLIIVGRRGGMFRPLALGAAAALCVLGLENKVQAILLIGALPLMILPFGTAGSASVPFWRNAAAAWLAVLGAVVLAAIALWLAWPLVATGYDRTLLDAANWHPLLLGRFGAYQIALLALIGACMIGYAVIWRISAAETLAAMAAVTAGAAFTLLILNINYNTANVIAVANPLEKMLSFADEGTRAASGSGLSSILLLVEGIGAVFARYSFVLYSSPRPTVFLTWLVIPGIVYAWRRGERQAALQALMLFGTSLGIDALGVRRGLKAEYFIFTDPLIILAGAILLDRLTDLRTRKWSFAIGAVLFGLQIAIGQAEPIKFAFKKTGPESICEWNQYYLPLLPLPWCPQP